MKCATDINIAVMMNCYNFGDPPAFHVAPLSGQNCTLSNSFVYLKNHQTQPYFRAN